MDRSGLFVGYLAGAKDSFPHVNRLATDKKPTHENVDAFLAIYGESFKDMMRNKVKKCSSCGKPCAFTLTLCNSCSAPLGEEILFTDNIFMCFVFGIARGAFPYTISIRSENDRFLVFDDLLALSPAHFNIIPTSTYIPDWRYLLQAPREGLALLQNLRETGKNDLRRQFWENEEFRSKFWPAIEMDEVIFAGFNYPPSQYQLHLQFICAPLTPFQYYQFSKENHFHYNRFFTYEYVEAILQAAIAESMKISINDGTTVGYIKQMFEAKGVSYDYIHRKQWARYHDVQRRCAAWNSEDFRFCSMGTVYTLDMTKTLEDGQKLQQMDKLVLQNYGRPYADEKPTGSYYSFPREPDKLERFGAA